MGRMRSELGAVLVSGAAAIAGCGSAQGSEAACGLGRADCAGVCVDLAGDDTNCGRCGNVCVGGRCIAGLCIESSSGGASGSGGVTSGGQPAGGTDAGGGASGGGGATTGGVAIGGVATGGALAMGGTATGGTATGGTATGGTATGGTMETGGSAATGGAAVCDGSWDRQSSKGDGVALTPPMGWNSWNAFHENINEQQIRQVADAMVSTGLRDAGYVYLNLDDKWMDDDGRDPQGNLVGDSVRFPSGMKALADYVHERGLKFGLYGDRGTETCAHFNANTPCESGSYGREARDAQTFASWGVDYLKYDNCAPAPGRADDLSQQQDYEAMSDALRATGRPIVFSICAWDAKPWMPSVGHLWRSTFDIGPCFSGCDEWYRNIDEIIDENNATSDWAGPGHWNDPDMMVIGHHALTRDENVAHFSLWAIMAAPIILGNDVRSMPSEIREILTNDEVIAVNQDPAGIQGTRVADDGDREVWMKPLCSPTGPEKAVVLFNRGGETANITVAFGDLGIAGTATVRDLWAHEDRGEHQQSYAADVPAHGAVMLKLVPR